MHHRPKMLSRRRASKPPFHLYRQAAACRRGERRDYVGSGVASRIAACVSITLLIDVDFRARHYWRGATSGWLSALDKSSRAFIWRASPRRSALPNGAAEAGRDII